MKPIKSLTTVSYYNGPLLYIVRNCGDSTNSHNRSILGVFTSPEEAREGITIAREKIEDKVQKENLQVRIVIPNTTMYLGCNEQDVEDLRRNPVYFEQQVRLKDFWKHVVKEHNEGYHL